MARAPTTRCRPAAAGQARRCAGGRKKLTLTESGAVGGFELDAPADRVVLSIKDAAGLEVKQIELSDVKANWLKEFHLGRHRQQE